MSKEGIKKVNPVARVMLQLRRPKQVVPPKRGGKSYKRKPKLPTNLLLREEVLLKHD